MDGRGGGKATQVSLWSHKFTSINCERSNKFTLQSVLVLPSVNKATAVIIKVMRLRMNRKNI
jgi:hypothetical protein